MNKFDKVVRDSQQKRLNGLATQIEALLRQAGDLCETMDDPDVGYLFIGNLDRGQLTAYMVGNNGLLSSAIAAAGRRNHLMGDVLLDGALAIDDEDTISTLRFTI